MDIKFNSGMVCFHLMVHLSNRIGTASLDTQA